jgi:glutathione S-transferase
MALVRQSPAHRDAAAVEASRDSWNRHMHILEAQFVRTDAYAAGPTFTLADIVLGLAVHRWLMTPIARPQLPAVAAYVERLRERPAFLQYASKGTP